MWCWLGRSCGGSVLTRWFNTFSSSYIFLMPRRPLHAQQNCTSKPLCCRHLSLFFLHETWWISLRCSTWSLHLWFRKTLAEAKDSLGGVGGNVDLRGPGNPHKWWLALAPSFPPRPSFFLSHVVLIIVWFCVLASFSSCLSAPHSPVLFT